MAKQDGQHSFASILLQLLDLNVSVGGKEKGHVIRDETGYDSSCCTASSCAGIAQVICGKEGVHTGSSKESK